MITEFDEYSDLPFSKRIQDELMARHSHRDLPGGSDEIVYTEADVLILLQMMQEEMPKKVFMPVGSASERQQGFSIEKESIAHFCHDKTEYRFPAFITEEEAKTFIEQNKSYDTLTVVEIPIFPETGVDLKAEARVKKREELRRRRKSLRFDMISGKGIDPFAAIDSLGIKYLHSVTQNVVNQVWFFGCENVPSELPKWITDLGLAESWINYGLTKQDVYEINNCDFTTYITPTQQKINWDEISSVPGFRRINVEPRIIDGKTMVRITLITDAE